MQVITYSVSLKDPFKSMARDLDLHLYLRVSPAHIATDIETGFPSLMLMDRNKILEFVQGKYQEGRSEIEDDGTWIFDFLEDMTLTLPSFIDHMDGLFLENLSVTLYQDLYQTPNPHHSL